MKNNQILLRSAVTVVATGLTLLASNNSEAGRGFSGKMAGGGHGGMTNGAMHQGIGTRGMNQVNRGDDRGGHRGHREPGDDHNRGMMLRGERQPGDDQGGHRERERRHGNDDGKRHDLRDDKGGHGERERRHGRDDGKRHDLRDDKGGRGEREHRHGERQPGDDRGRI